VEWERVAGGPMIHYRPAPNVWSPCGADPYSSPWTDLVEHVRRATCNKAIRRLSKACLDGVMAPSCGSSTSAGVALPSPWIYRQGRRAGDA
jgi:hypothetical protein